MVEERIIIFNLLPCSSLEFTRKISGFDIEKQKLLNSELKKMVEEGLIEIQVDGEVRYDLTQKGKEVWETLSRKELIEVAKEWEIHPAGGVIPEIKLFYEPLNEKEVVYNWNGKKGLAQIKEAKGGLFYIEIEGKRFWFQEPPLREKEFIFNLPDTIKVYDWVNGKKKALSNGEIYNLVKNCIEVFFDFGDKIFYDVATLSVFHSWLRHISPATWFLGIYGAWGSGKTSLGELLAKLCYHGYLVANPSVAFVGRSLDRLKITPFLDEADAISDPELLSLIRQGYRKGQKYSRIDKEGGMITQSFDVYTLWIMSVHGMLDEALMSRCYPIATIETQDKRLPIINLLKQLQDIYTELFIWWGENSINFPSLEIKNISLNPSVEETREALYKLMVETFSPEELEQLKDMAGRSLELGFLMLRTSKLLGNTIDLREAFKIAQETMQEIRESGILGTLRDYLVTLYKEFKDYPEFRNSAGEFMLPNKDVFTRFNDYLLTTRRMQISPREFRAMILDLGFSGQARKNMNIKSIQNLEEEPTSRLALIFTANVCRKIALDYSKMVEEGKRLKEQRTLQIPKKEVTEVKLENML
jgi:predicted transcriptional regulator